MLQPRECNRCNEENEPTALYSNRCGTPLTTKVTLATKSKEGDEITRLREEVNNLRKLIMQGTGIKVEYLQEAYRKAITEESEGALKSGKVVMTNKEFDALPEEEKNMHPMYARARVF